jgi:hypothetical protein
MKFKPLLLSLVTIFLVDSCTAGRFSARSDFKLNSSSLVSVDLIDDPMGVGNYIEGELLTHGIETVPYELAKTRIEKNTLTIKENNSKNESSSLGMTTYIPAAILLRINYTHLQGLSNDAPINNLINNFNVRIIDLSNERTLSIYTWSGFGNTKKDVIGKFIKELEKYVK